MYLSCLYTYSLIHRDYTDVRGLYSRRHELLHLVSITVPDGLSTDVDVLSLGLQRPASLAVLACYYLCFSPTRAMLTIWDSTFDIYTDMVDTSLLN